MCRDVKNMYHVLLGSDDPNYTEMRLQALQNLEEFLKSEELKLIKGDQNCTLTHFSICPRNHCCVSIALPVPTFFGILHCHCPIFSWERKGAGKLERDGSSRLRSGFNGDSNLLAGSSPRIFLRQQRNSLSFCFGECF